MPMHTLGQCEWPRCSLQWLARIDLNPHWQDHDYLSAAPSGEEPGNRDPGWQARSGPGPGRFNVGYARSIWLLRGFHRESFWGT